MLLALQCDVVTPHSIYELTFIAGMVNPRDVDAVHVLHGVRGNCHERFSNTET